MPADFTTCLAEIRGVDVECTPAQWSILYTMVTRYADAQTGRNIRPSIRMLAGAAKVRERWTHAAIKFQEDLGVLVVTGRHQVVRAIDWNVLRNLTKQRLDEAMKEAGSLFDAHNCTECSYQGTRQQQRRFAPRPSARTDGL